MIALEDLTAQTFSGEQIRRLFIPFTNLAVCLMRESWAGMRGFPHDGKIVGGKIIAEGIEYGVVSSMFAPYHGVFEECPFHSYQLISTSTLPVNLDSRIASSSHMVRSLIEEINDPTTMFTDPSGEIRLRLERIYSELAN